MNKRFGLLAIGLAFTVLVGFAGRANALMTHIYVFEVRKNGALLFQDSFDDATPPPSAPSFSLPPFNAAGYFVQGTFPAGSEADGRLLLDSANGANVFSPIAGINVDIQRARLLTNNDPSDFVLGLKTDDSFLVSGIFDLAAVDTLISGYGIALSDPAPTALNQLVVGTRNYGGGTVIALYYADNVNGSESVIASVPATLGEQVEFLLSRPDPGSNLVTAGYRYLGDPSFTFFADPGGAANIFNFTTFTQAEFRAFSTNLPAGVPEPATLALLFLALAGLGLRQRRGLRSSREF